MLGDAKWPAKISANMNATAAEPFLPDVIRAALEHGEVPRSEVPAIAQTSVRTGQRITRSLLDAGYVQSAGNNAPLIFSIPAAARDRWFPSLYPSLPASA